MRKLGFIGLVLIGSWLHGGQSGALPVGEPPGAALRDRATGSRCYDSGVRGVHLSEAVAIDRFVVEPLAGGGQAPTEVIVSTGRASRVLHVADVQRGLRFYPAMRGVSFDVQLNPSGTRSACVGRVTLFSGDVAVAVLEP